MHPTGIPRRWRWWPQMLKFLLRLLRPHYHLITDLIHLWYDDTYWSKILGSIMPTTLGHVKVKLTLGIFMLKVYVKASRISLLLN